MTGTLGALVVVLEGVQQLFQWHNGWLRNRTTAEALRWEGHAYEGRADEYAVAEDPAVVLFNRIRAIASAEHIQWGRLSRRRTSKPGRN